MPIMLSPFDRPSRVARPQTPCDGRAHPDPRAAGFPGRRSSQTLFAVGARGERMFVRGGRLRACRAISQAPRKGLYRSPHPTLSRESPETAGGRRGRRPAAQSFLPAHRQAQTRRSDAPRSPRLSACVPTFSRCRDRRADHSRLVSSRLGSPAPEPRPPAWGETD
jgi:hypothetical protein